MIPKPAYHQYEDFQIRSQKLKAIREAGIEPYPHKYIPTHTAEELVRTHEGATLGHSEEAMAGKTEEACIAGRLVLFRAMGKNIFAQIQDHTGKLQVMFNRDQTHVTGYVPERNPDCTSALKFIEKRFDLGDWLGLKGHLFRTGTGELTILVKEVTLLGKSLLPLPDKHAGLTDKELRYRKRWLDLIDHPDVAKKFLLRSRILQHARRYFEGLGFQEVETPILQNVYGGANAKPFITHLNALSQEMFLRISLEIPLKKLITGGLPKVFEIGRVFRNEGIDRTHNPEFTELEAYAAYWDYSDMMHCMEHLVETLALMLFQDTKFKVTDRDNPEKFTLIDVKTPWPRLSMKASILQYAAIDVDASSEEDLRRHLRQDKTIKPEAIAAANKGLLTTMLFESFVEHHLIQPIHIIDHPIESTPLCKLHRDPKERAAGIVERFESFVLGKEICNSYSELNDPELQRELLEQQARRRDQGDEEACPLDEEFIEAICQGMPPTSGLGIGLDRLVMLLTDAHSIRDVLFFPLMRPEN